MLKNLILSAAAAGVAAGLFTAVVQHVTTTPIIIEAEKYEGGAVAHDHAAGTPAHDHGAAANTDAPAMSTPAEEPSTVVAAVEEEEWAPSDGLQRTLYTSFATTVIGIGFGLALLGAMALVGVGINARTGLAFGVAAFIAVALAPSLGLPPEIPGSGAAELGARQMWWFFAVGATAIGIGGLLLGKNAWLQIGGVVLIALPHLVGAPHPHEYVSTAPAELAGHFVATSLAVTAIFWAVLGYASGAFYERISRGG
jgi:cobalt transporter subunit CbtA